MKKANTIIIFYIELINISKKTKDYLLKRAVLYGNIL